MAVCFLLEMKGRSLLLKQWLKRSWIVCDVLLLKFCIVEVFALYMVANALEAALFYYENFRVDFALNYPVCKKAGSEL